MGALGLVSDPFVHYFLNSLDVVAEGRVNSTISEVERDVLELFVRVAAVLNLPRSVGELYGLLFVSPEPLCIDDLTSRLGISKGSTSQGLKILRSFGAVRTVYVPGMRRDYFVAEAQLRKIARGFIDEQVRPHLDSGQQRLQRIRELIESDGGEHRDFLAERVTRLQGWHRRATRLLPLALSVIKRD